jgi:hypothetical protein
MDFNLQCGRYLRYPLRFEPYSLLFLLTQLMRYNEVYTFDGYKRQVVTQTNNSITFAEAPHGGHLVTRSTTSGLNSTTVQVSSILSISYYLIVDEPCGFSSGTLAGVIVGAAICGLLLGALGIWGLNQRGYIFNIQWNC